MVALIISFCFQTSNANNKNPLPHALLPVLLGPDEPLEHEDHKSRGRLEALVVYGYEKGV
jgi:hypothetical protein